LTRSTIRGGVDDNYEFKELTVINYRVSFSFNRENQTYTILKLALFSIYHSIKNKRCKNCPYLLTHLTDATHVSAAVRKACAWHYIWEELRCRRVACSKQITNYPKNCSFLPKPWLTMDADQPRDWGAREEVFTRYL